MATSAMVDEGGPDTLALSAVSRASIQRQAEALQQIAATRRARSVAVPTVDAAVRLRLRRLALPICLFGEGPADRRERLREALVARALAGQIDEEETRRDAAGAAHVELVAVDADDALPAAPRVEDGGAALLAARRAIAAFSLARARERVGAEHAERRRREALSDDEREAVLAAEERAHADACHRAARLASATSEFGDSRPLSACRFSPAGRHVLTASWRGEAQLWEAEAAAARVRKRAVLAGHAERVSDVAFHPEADAPGRAAALLAAMGCSVDGSACLWPAAWRDEEDEAEATEPRRVQPLARLALGARPSRLAMHPSGAFAAVSLFDCSWALWDLATRRALLRQQGHSAPLGAIACHPDGSLVATGDQSGAAAVWDIRSGELALPLSGHARQVVAADFAAGGWLLATGGEDHSARLWDLRGKRALYVLPAHANLVSSVRFAPRDARVLLTASFDRTLKLWSARDGAPLATLVGHEERVMAADIAPDGAVASAAWDRVWKLWAPPRDAGAGAGAGMRDEAPPL